MGDLTNTQIDKVLSDFLVDRDGDDYLSQYPENASSECVLMETPRIVCSVGVQCDSSLFGTVGQISPVLESVFSFGAGECFMSGSNTAENHCNTVVMQQIASMDSTRLEVASSDNTSYTGTLNQSRSTHQSHSPSTPSQSAGSSPVPLPPTSDTTSDLQVTATLNQVTADNELLSILKQLPRESVPAAPKQVDKQQVVASPVPSTTPPPLENIKQKREVTKRFGLGAHKKSIRRCSRRKTQSKKKKLFKTAEPCPAVVIQCINCCQAGTIICDDCISIFKSNLIKYEIFRQFMKTLF